MPPTECHNSDWWFVRKHLTEEAGWVPASYLKNEDEYNHYVQRKLSDKIGKLPVFEGRIDIARNAITVSDL